MAGGTDESAGAAVDAGEAEVFPDRVTVGRVEQLLESARVDALGDGSGSTVGDFLLLREVSGTSLRKVLHRRLAVVGQRLGQVPSAKVGEQEVEPARSGRRAADRRAEASIGRGVAGQADQRRLLSASLVERVGLPLAGKELVEHGDARGIAGTDAKDDLRVRLVGFLCLVRPARLKPEHGLALRE